MVWAIFGAGVVVAGFALFYSLVIWLGSWPAALAASRLSYLGLGLLLSWFAVIIVVVVFGLGGPLGRLKGSVGSINIEAQGVSDDTDKAAGGD